MAKKPLGVNEKYLEFTIDEHGEVSVEAHGFTGRTCQIASQDYEKALGLVSNRKEKQESVKLGVKIGA
jgi:hypothetical protein